MDSGTVKWFSDAKGYGFIAPTTGGADIFVHFSGVRCPGLKSLAEGDAVTYRTIDGRKGPEAHEVRKVGP